MCWTQEISLAFGVAGTVTAVYKTYTTPEENIKNLTIPLFFFCVMELLQFFSYFYIDNCTSSSNQLLTLLSYLHICLQPIFFNMMYMYFIPVRIKNKIRKYVYAACAIFSFIMFMRVYPALFPWEGSVAYKCEQGQALCGENMCSVSGDWHIAWEVPLYNLPYIGNTPSYFTAVFLIPLLYGAWKAVLVGSIFGPIIALVLSKNPNEQPAIWCLFSVALFIIVMYTPLQQKLKTKKWFLYKYF